MERQKPVVAPHDRLLKSSSFQAAGAQLGEIVVILDMEDAHRISRQWLHEPETNHLNRGSIWGDYPMVLSRKRVEDMFRGVLGTSFLILDRPSAAATSWGTDRQG